MSKYVLTNNYNALINKLLEQEPTLQHINRWGITVGVFEREGGKTSAGKTVFADIGKTPDKFKPFCDFEYLITIYTDSCRGFTDEQMLIVLFHELLHIKVEEITDDAGEIMNIKLTTRGHDLEDFKVIIDRWGTNWSKKNGEFEQITIFDKEEDDSAGEEVSNEKET